MSNFSNKYSLLTVGVIIVYTLKYILEVIYENSNCKRAQEQGICNP
jgi:hypothetical protein